MSTGSIYKQIQNSEEEREIKSQNIVKTTVKLKFVPGAVNNNRTTAERKNQVKWKMPCLVYQWSFVKKFF